MPLADSSASKLMPDAQGLDVTLVRRVVQVGRWDSVSWDLADVRLAGADTPDAPPDAGDRVVHRGIPLRLYRDQVDDYHYNLSSERPRLFLVCSPDPTDDSLDPRLATLSQGEALDYMETEDEVLSCPLTGDLRAWVEAWLQLSPVPAPQRKNKRRHQVTKE
jgi:hypothetical protein